MLTDRGGDHENDFLPLFIREMRFYRPFIILLLAAVCSTAVADVGQTHQLKQERSELLIRISALNKDTSKAAELIVDSLEGRIIELDEAIMKSYDETIDRLAAQKINSGTNSKTVVYLALFTSLMVILLASLMLVARKRLAAGGYKGWLHVYTQMGSDLLKEVSMEKAANSRLLRVNVVVIVGLFMMSLSVVAFLLSTL
ncbi:MAG: hypothetical protein RL266_2013 [Bacteroidota bacterium]